VTIKHSHFKAGDLCPTACGGRLWNAAPGTVIKISGQGFAKATHYTIDTLIVELENNRSICWDNIVQLIEDYSMSKETKMMWGSDKTKQNKTKQKEYEKYMIDCQVATQDQINQCNENSKHWSQEKVEQIRDEQQALLRSLADAINKRLQPQSKEVQILIQKHFENTKHFWAFTKQSYLALAQFYRENPDLEKLFHSHHSMLGVFLSEAMIVFAENELE
jgi:chromosome condensin MukBEF ATPase and DNA-binding subunit MukB